MKNRQRFAATQPLIQTAARIFISYSFNEGAAAAAELRQIFPNKNLSVWQDIIALGAGGLGAG